MCFSFITMDLNVSLFLMYPVFSLFFLSEDIFFFNSWKFSVISLQLLKKILLLYHSPDLLLLEYLLAMCGAEIPSTQEYQNIYSLKGIWMTMPFCSLQLKTIKWKWKWCMLSRGWGREKAFETLLSFSSTSAIMEEGLEWLINELLLSHWYLGMFVTAVLAYPILTKIGSFSIYAACLIKLSFIVFSHLFLWYNLSLE